MTNIYKLRAQLLTEQEALMESIVTRFTGKVWRDFKWRDAE